MLGDKEKRQKYDTFGSAEGFVGGQNFDPSDFGFHTYTYQTSSGGNDFSDFFNLIFGNDRGGAKSGGSRFADFGFGNTSRRNRPRYETDLTISLEEAYRGTKRDLSVNINGQNLTIPLKVPEGILPGKKIKIRGEKFGLDGDLYVKINILDSKNKLDGLDITKTVTLAPWEAYFGTSKNIRTLSGTIRVNFPKNINGGQKIRIAGKGFKDMKGREGDLYLEVELVNPALTPEEEEIYQKLMN